MTWEMDQKIMQKRYYQQGEKSGEMIKRWNACRKDCQDNESSCGRSGSAKIKKRTSRQHIGTSSFTINSITAVFPAPAACQISRIPFLKPYSKYSHTYRQNIVNNQAHIPQPFASQNPCQDSSQNI